MRKHALYGGRGRLHLLFLAPSRGYTRGGAFSLKVLAVFQRHNLY